MFAISGPQTVDRAAVSPEIRVNSSNRVKKIGKIPMDWIWGAVNTVWIEESDIEPESEGS